MILRTAFCLALTFLTAAPCLAQSETPSTQILANEDKLDQLFAKLQLKDLGSAAIKTEAEIWDLWMKSGNESENQQLYAATRMMDIGQFALAETKLNELIAQTQNFPEAYNKRATLYFLMGKLDESLADIVTTLELEPRHFGALSGRGMILAKQKKYAEALKAYRDALVMNPYMFGVIATVQQLEKLEQDL